MNLLEINDIDFTDYLLQHNVNNSPVYYRWTDGNFVTHREWRRDTIKGSLTFYLPDDGGVVYNELRQAIADATDPQKRITTIKVYVDNLDQVREVVGFCDLSPSIEKLTANGVLFNEFTLTIEEQ